MFLFVFYIIRALGYLYVCMNTSYLQKLEEGIGSLELEIQGVVNHLI